jgi:hypothetical protein
MMGLEHLITEQQIRHRSYCIWEADGRQPGRCEEYWARAKAELKLEFEQSCDIALAEVENLALVMPRPPISKQPFRHEAARIDPDWDREAA